MSAAQQAVEFSEPTRVGLNRLAQVALPVVIVAFVLAFAVGSRLGADGGNLTGLIQFGDNFAQAVHPPSHALVSPGDGYDGQFFYVQAQDPLLLHDATVQAMRAAHQAFRLERVAYPALALVLAGGQRSAVPFALLAVNVLVLLALTAGFAVYARRRGCSTLWAVAVGLMPGMLLPALRDLSDPLAAASMLTGLLLWRSNRRWPAALALALAVLTREVMMLAVAAVVIETGIRAYAARGQTGAWRRLLIRAWPVVVIPTAVFAGWRGYVMTRYGASLGGADLQIPFMNLIDELRRSFADGYPPLAAWDLIYVLLILAASAAVLASLLKRATITNVAACAMALGVLVPTLGDAWSDTRLSAPLFLLLLVDGQARRHRASLMIVAAAAAMTILIPVGIPHSF